MGQLEGAADLLWGFTFDNDRPECYSKICLKDGGLFYGLV